MALDLAALLDRQAYARLGVVAEVRPKGGVAKTLTVLDRPLEVEAEAAGGLTVPSVANAVRLRLAELADNGLARADLEDAEITIGGTLYAVLATRPAGNRREIELILTERA